MMTVTLYHGIVEAKLRGDKLLSVLLDPDKFEVNQIEPFLSGLPVQATHFFVGGSTVPQGRTEALVKAMKRHTEIPIILFPGDFTQITNDADGLLFLSLLSGQNPEYLIGQQKKAVPLLRASGLEIIPTAYLLIDGGKESAVARVTETTPLDPNHLSEIIAVAKAGEYMGAKLVYLEAGSGAMKPVPADVIKAVASAINIPILVGGGIRNGSQLEAAYTAGADMVVMGTVFEAMNS